MNEILAWLQSPASNGMVVWLNVVALVSASCQYLIWKLQPVTVAEGTLSVTAASKRDATKVFKMLKKMIESNHEE